MKKCYVCKKEIPTRSGEVCSTCEQFFRWKYGKDYQRFLKQHKKVYSHLEKLPSIKSRGRKK